MDYESYSQKYFVQPPPKKKAGIIAQQGTSIYVKDYQKAIKFCSEIFGAPQYIEGKFVNGWKLGSS